MKTIREIIPQAVQYLSERKVQDARRSAEEIIAFVLGYKRLDLYMNFDCPIKEQELEKIRDLLKKRGKGTPIDYLFGQKAFYGNTFLVTPDVLIPRPETEILVDLIVKRLEKENLEGKALWEVACGSGCVGLSLKKRFPALTVALSDISEPALEVAKKNSIKTQLEVEFFLGDFLKPFASQKAHYLVLNPPYISQQEYEELDPEVRNFEPRGALLGGSTGLEFYERLSREGASYLHPSAKIFLEIGSKQGSALKKIFAGPDWSSQELIPDWAGHDRFFFLEKT
jgi:release factor glutamine methyltransferase